MNETAAESNATIQLRSGNFTSNLTITYEPCSGASSTTQFRPPVVHLENLTADITYCYSITYNGNSGTQVAGSCNGIFHTTADTTAHTPSTTGSYNHIFKSAWTESCMMCKEVCKLLHKQQRKDMHSVIVTREIRHSLYSWICFSSSACQMHEWLKATLKCLLVAFPQ